MKRQPLTYDPPRPRRMRAVPCLKGLFLAAVLALAAGCTLSDWFPAEVGVLVPLHGDLAQAGNDALAAAELAEDDAAAAQGFPKIRVTVSDTYADPRTALYALTEMSKNKRLRIVAGPMTSGSVENVRLYAERNDIVVLSPSSTSPALAIAGDSVYRMVPDDTKEAKALAEYIRAAGIEALIIAYRDDSYGQAMAGTIHAQLRETVAGHYPYAANTAEFSSVAASIAAGLNNAALLQAPEKIGLLLLAFDEGAALTDALRTTANAGAYPWFCSSSLTSSTALLDSPERAVFLAEAGLAGPQLSLGAATGSAEYQRVAQVLAERLGHVPHIYAYYMYDAVRIAISSSQQIWPRLFRDFQPEFEGVAQGYAGITGNVTLNAAGDRSEGAYEFWQVQESGGTAAWALLGGTQ